MAWQEVKLESVIREEREPIGSFDGDGLPVLGVTNVAGVTHTGIEASDDKSKYFRLRPNRFVFNPYRVNVGSLGLTSFSQDGIASPAYVIFRTTDALDSHFLCHFLKSRRGNQLINFHGNRGSVRSALRFADLCQMEIPLPPIPEQQRIVARIEELAAQIAEARSLRMQSTEEAEVVLSAAENSRFGTAASPNWKARPLESLCSVFIDCDHKTPDYVDEGIPLLRPRDIKPYLLTTDRAVLIAQHEHELRCRRHRPVAGDLVYSRELSFGNAAAIPEGIEVSLGQGTMLMRANPTEVTAGFLLRALNAPVVRDQAKHAAKGAAHPHVNLCDIRNFAIPMPALPEQRRIVAYLDDLQAKVDALKTLQAKTAAELDALLPSILDKAFKGEL